jgi:hypothetical chaperone protein
LSHRLVRSAERAKIGLSETAVVPIDLGFVEQGLEGRADRARFAAACERLLTHLHGLVTEALAHSGTPPDVIYLTGGMARSAIVRSYLQQEFPSASFVDSNHFSSVTEGLTLWAGRLFEPGPVGRLP